MLKLDEQARKATVAAQYGREENLDPDYMGDTQPLGDGNVFVGWGDEPYVSEFDHSGKLLFEGEFPRPDLTYRALLEQWVGLPLYPPVGAARLAGGRTTVYASWNGATQVASWRVLGGPSAGQLARVVDQAQIRLRDRDRGLRERLDLRRAGLERRRTRDRRVRAIHREAGLRTRRGTGGPLARGAGRSQWRRAWRVRCRSSWRSTTLTISFMNCSGPEALA